MVSYRQKATIIIAHSESKLAKLTLKVLFDVGQPQVKEKTPQICQGFFSKMISKYHDK